MATILETAALETSESTVTEESEETKQEDELTEEDHIERSNLAGYLNQFKVCTILTKYILRKGW